MRLSLVITSLPLLVLATQPDCTGQNKGYRTAGGYGFSYDWSEKQWKNLWEVRDRLCTDHWQTSGSVQINDAQAQSGIRGNRCSKQSCLNNLNEAILQCMDTSHGKLSTGATINDYQGDCWYWIFAGNQPKQFT